MKKLMVGNWKMNGSLDANGSLIGALQQDASTWHCDVAVCAPAVYLAQLHTLLAGGRIALGAQDLSAHEGGAYTGEVSAAMLKEFGVRYCIVGHSERRQYHQESDAAVAVKAQRALAAGITNRHANQQNRHPANKKRHPANKSRHPTIPNIG